MILILFSFFLLIPYVLLFAALGKFWRNNSDEVTREEFQPEISVSVVIPFRNEEKSIAATLHNLMLQNYPTELLEIIAVDDHSSDQGLNLVKKFAGGKFPLRLVQNKTGEGKKTSIRTGIHQSKAEIIITLDADILVGPEWVKSIIHHYSTHKSSMIILPVMYSGEQGLFQKLQSLEFISLIGTTASTALSNRAVMCNGANLAFQRKAYNEISCDDLQPGISSGDDMFLMFLLKKKNTESITYLKNKNTIGWTRPCTTIKDFTDQRVRWASKAGAYKEKDSIVLAAFIWILNILMTVTLLLGISDFRFILLFIGQVLIKGISDFVFLQPFAEWFNKKFTPIHYFLLTLTYPFYATLIPVIGIFYRPKWKDRAITLFGNRSNTSE